MKTLRRVGRPKAGEGNDSNRSISAGAGPAYLAARLRREAPAQIEAVIRDMGRPGDDNAACYHQTPSSSDASPDLPSSGRNPRHQVLRLDQLPRGRRLVEAHRRRLGARGPDRPGRQVSGCPFHPFGDGRLRLGDLCGALCDDRLRRGALGERERVLGFF